MYNEADQIQASLDYMLRKVADDSKPVKNTGVNMGKSTHLQELENNKKLGLLAEQRKADKYYRQTMDKILATQEAKRLQTEAMSVLLHPWESAQYLIRKPFGIEYRSPQQKAFADYIRKAYEEEIANSINPFVVMNNAKLLQLGGDRIRGQQQDYEQFSVWNPFTWFGNSNPDKFYQDPVRSTVTNSPEMKNIENITKEKVKQHISDLIAKWGPLIAVLGLGGIGLMMMSRSENKNNSSQNNPDMNKAYLDWANRANFGE